MQRERLEMDADPTCFNAGMMPIGLDAWLEANVLERGMAYAIENGDKLSNWDQDVLNHLFGKACLAVTSTLECQLAPLGTWSSLDGGKRGFA